MDIGRAKLPVPGGGQGPTVPGDLAAFALVVDAHLMQHAVDQADRNTRYADAPLHTVVSGEDGSLWVKTSATLNSWATAYEPIPDWRPLSLKAGFALSGETPIGIRRIGTRVYLQGRVLKVDGTNLDGEAINVGSVPADCIPKNLRTWVGGCSMAGATTDGAGRWELLGTDSSSGVGVAGDLLWWYQGTGGTPWVDLAGSYWTD